MASIRAGSRGAGSVDSSAGSIRSSSVSGPPSSHATCSCGASRWNTPQVSWVHPMDTIGTRLRRRAKQLRARANMPVKWAAYEAGLTHGPFFPDRLYVESTNYCNLKCIMCPTGLGVIQRPKGYMDLGLYQRIIDEVAPSAPSIVLHSWGEPMMHPDLFTMVRYARERDLWVETS